MPTPSRSIRIVMVAGAALAMAAGASYAMADDTAQPKAGQQKAGQPEAGRQKAGQPKAGQQSSLQARSVKAFPANAKFDYQIGSAYTPPSGVKVVSRDVGAAPAAGLYNVCYINGFQTQPDDSAGSEGTSRWFAGDATRRKLLLPNPTPSVPTADDGGKYSRDFYVDPGWPDEIMFDVRTAANRDALAQIIGKQITTCAGKGFDAVEVDNLDTFTRAYADVADRERARTDPDFDGTDAPKLMTSANALAYAKLLIDRAHAAGLAIAQKNTAELEGDGKAAGFDFAVVEECGSTGECADYAGVYGGKWVDVEYSSSGFTKACRSVKSKISVVRRDQMVTAPGSRTYVYDEC
ncbi:endo alpha-1,4 polygalactosaminidase [Actinoplanes sp. NPDC049316]|uniref:endo alpha-1,4 polygalactosaminidase n=1 Tax=Actinoplanes sp. NPDC049316 TaxID=3154727 RepID=UPI0034177CD3